MRQAQLVDGRCLWTNELCKLFPELLGMRPFALNMQSISN